MTWFRTGFAVFVAGVLVRWFFKYRYYKDFRDNAHTDLQKQEMRTKYRPRIFIGLGIEVAGCIICFISLLAE